MSGTMALMPTMLQNLMKLSGADDRLDPWHRAASATMIAMFVVGAADQPDRQPADHPDGF